MAILKSGIVLPRDVQDEILGRASNTSAFAQASTQVPLTGNGLDFVTIGELDANWVAEGAVKPTTQPTITQKQIDAYTLVSKFVVSKQVAADAGNLFDALIEQGAPGLARAFDRTVAGFKAAPGANFDSLGGAATAVVTDYASLVDAFGAAAANGNEPTAIVATATFIHQLRGLTYGDGRPVLDYAANTIFNVPVYTFKTVAGDTPAAWVGNFDLAKWGQVEAIEVKLSEDATVEGVSMFDTNSIAVRIEARYGFVVASVSDYAKLSTTAPAAG